MELDINRIWDRLKYPEKLRKHCLTVNRKSLEICDKLASDGIKADRGLVSWGSLLHDIGRGEKHSIQHAVLGYKKCRELGVSEDVAQIVRNHIGAGIDKDEAAALGLSAENFLPETLEQKIVSYADNLVDNNKVLTFEKELKNWTGRWGADSKQVKRFRMQHEELENYATGADMKELERKSGKTTGELMEKAGKGVAEFIKKTFDTTGKSVIFFCGSGNNGGDGFVAARHLRAAGIHTEAVVFGDQKTAESRENLSRALKAGVIVNTIHSDESASRFAGDILVDAIFGTGIQGEIEEPIASVIKWINSLAVPKVSIDVPSGINPDTVAHANVFVRPDCTLCIGRVKKGLVGSQYTGEISVVPIF